MSTATTHACWTKGGHAWVQDDGRILDECSDCGEPLRDSMRFTIAQQQIAREVADNLRAHFDRYCEREGSRNADGTVRPISHSELGRRAGFDRNGRHIRLLIATSNAKQPPTWPRPDVLAALAAVIGCKWHELLVPPR